MSTATQALVVLTVTLATAACSGGDLTRREAKRQLEASARFMHTATVEIGPFYSTRSLTLDSARKVVTVKDTGGRAEAAILNALQGAGLVTLEITEGKVEGLFGAHRERLLVATLTKKGKGQAGDGAVNLFGPRGWSFPIATKTSVTVTGIAEAPALLGIPAGGARLVKVSWEWELNELGRALPEPERVDSREYGTKKRDAIFVKYDDGWRLEEDSLL